MPDDFAGDSSTAQSLTTGQAITGALETSGDSDWFRVSLIAGFAYQFNVAASVKFLGGGLGLTLIRNDNTVVSGGNGIKSVTITPTISATYFVAVAASTGNTGPYTVNSNTGDDDTNDFSTNGKINVNGGPTNGALQTSADHDYFGISLAAGTTYKFSVSAAVNFTSSGLNERLIRSDGVPVNNGDNYVYGDRNYSFSIRRSPRVRSTWMSSPVRTERAPTRLPPPPPPQATRPPQVCPYTAFSTARPAPSSSPPATASAPPSSPHAAT